MNLFTTYEKEGRIMDDYLSGHIDYDTALDRAQRRGARHVELMLTEGISPTEAKRRIEEEQ